MAGVDFGKGLTSAKGDLLVHNGTTYTRVPVGANGQRLTADSAEATGVKWQTPSGGTGAWTFISTTTASTTATIEFTGLSSTYFKYAVEISNLAPDTDGVFFQMRTSTNNGSSYDSGASDYGWTAYGRTLSGGQGDEDNADSKIVFLSDGPDFLGNDANEISSLSVELINPSEVNWFKCRYFGNFVRNNAGTMFVVNGGGFRFAAADVDAVQFSMSSGNIASGTFKLYGLSSS